MTKADSSGWRLLAFRVTSIYSRGLRAFRQMIEEPPAGQGGAKIWLTPNFFILTTDTDKSDELDDDLARS